MKFTIQLMAFLILSSCSILFESLNPDSFLSEVGMTSIKDPITEDVRYTSNKMIKLNEERKTIFTPAKNNMFMVLNAIKINPYLVKTKEEMQYFLQVTVTGKRGSISNQLMMRCNEKPFITHKFTEEEKQGINVTELSYVSPLNPKNTLAYQEEVIETKITPEVFDYLASCSSDILMRAKGPKGEIDSSMQIITGEMDKFHQGMEGYKSIIQKEQIKIPKS